MSAGGLIAQAVLGGTAQAAKGIGDRIRADAKQARAEAILDKRTAGAIKQDENRSVLNREENVQKSNLGLAKQEAVNDDARGRIRLTDEVGQKRYENVTDDEGNVIGQREKESGKVNRFPTSAVKDMSLTDRQEAYAKSLTDRIKAIDDSAEYGAVSPEDMERRDAMEVQLNALFAGSGQFSELMNGQGGQGGADPDTPGPDETTKTPGLLEQAMAQQDTQSQQSQTISELDKLDSEADDALARIKPKKPAGGTPYANYAKEKVSAEDRAAAQSAADKLVVLYDDPERFGALSDRQQTKLVQRIMELKNAGVTINRSQ